jgi:predicted ABC-type ATPase
MPARIFVIAGVNGAGKSSIGGAALLARDVPYFNPDLAARALLRDNPGLGIDEANGYAWAAGRRGLERALQEGATFAFQTTLGANPIPEMLMAGARAGDAIHMWYAGLASPELHLQRVRARVAAGGHDIPEHMIRERYVSSRANLLRLLPHLRSLRLHDNSAESDPKAGNPPRPVLLLHMDAARIVSHAPLNQVPQWAKPVFAGAFDLSPSGPRPRNAQSKP